MPTIGVAVAIPEPWATELQDYRTSVGDVTATQIPTHITLIPPVVVEDDRLARCRGAPRAVADGVDAFRIHLRGTGTFRPVSPVVFVSLVEGISSASCWPTPYDGGRWRSTSASPTTRTSPSPTTSSDAQLDRAFDELDDFECEFAADHFALYVHDADAGWQPTREFALRPAPPDSEPPCRSSTP